MIHHEPNSVLRGPVDQDSVAPRDTKTTIMRFLRHVFLPTEKWSVKSILRTGLIVALIAAVLLTLSILHVTTSIKDTSRAVSKTYEVITALNKLEANLVDAETAERGFVIAGASTYLGPYLDAVQQIRWKLALISAFTSPNRSQLTRVERLEQLVSDKLKTLQMIIDARQEGSAEAAQLLVSIEQDKVEMDRIRLVLNDMETHANQVLDVRIAARDAAYRQFWWYFGTLIGIMLAGGVWQYLLVRRSIRLSDQHRAHVRYLADHDALTGLPNRRLLQARLELAISYGKRNGNMLAVMFIDLDGFKKVNDTLGHQAGDDLLAQVSKRLAGTVRANDTAGRLGGDEFIVVASNLSDIAAATHLAATLIDVIASPYQIAGKHTKISASIGISFYPADGDSAKLLLAKADGALANAKAGGKNQYKLA